MSATWPSTYFLLCTLAVSTVQHFVVVSEPVCLHDNHCRIRKQRQMFCNCLLCVWLLLLYSNFAGGEVVLLPSFSMVFMLSALFPQVCKFASIAAAGDNTCALTDEGVAMCWGEQWTDSVRKAVIAPIGERFVGISTSKTHTCASSSGNKGICWDRATYWRLGPSVLDDESAVDLLFQQVSAGAGYSCGVTTDSKVRCVGIATDTDDLEPQEAVPNSLVIDPEEPIDASYLEVTASDAMGATCARLSNGHVTCWPGTILYGSANGSIPTFPQNNYTQLAIGSFHVCALRGNGTLICLDNNRSPQHVGAVKNVPALDLETRYARVAVGDTHACAITSLGSALCWGEGGSGQLEVPKQTTGAEYAQIAAGRGHSCALLSDGQIVCWGDNTHGQLNVPYCTSTRTKPVVQ